MDFIKYFRLILSLLILISSFHLWAGQKYFYYFGGGGEKTDSQNQFDDSFKYSYEFAKKNNWTKNFLVDIDHPSTQKVMQSLPAKDAAKIYPFNYKFTHNDLENLLIRINNNEIGPDDQILLNLSSHGEDIVNGARPTKRTQVVLDDGSSTNLLPLLKKIAEAAQAKKIKTAFVFQNCYSGRMLQELSEIQGLCVVSSSQTDRVSYSNFSEFSKQLSQSDNIEEAYLKSRIDLNSPYHPMINTPVGIKVAHELKFVKDIYFDHYDWENAYQNRICSNIPLKLNQLKDLAVKMKNHGFLNLSIEQIEKEMILVQQRMAEIDKTMSGIEIPPFYLGFNYDECLSLAPDKKNNQEFCRGVFKYSDEEFQANVDAEEAINNGESLKARKLIQPYHVGMFVEAASDAEIKKLIADEKKRLNLLKNNKQYSEARQSLKEYRATLAVKQAQSEKAIKDKMEQKDRAYEETWNQSFERKLYDSLYQYYSSQRPQSNACRDFKLK